MTRAEHLQWAKDRALAYLTPEQPQPQERRITYSGGFSPWGRVHHPTRQVSAQDLNNAFTSFISDLRKHPELQGHMAIELGMAQMMGQWLDNETAMREFINGTQ